jgi:hypothetical protein
MRARDQRTEDEKDALLLNAEGVDVRCEMFCVMRTERELSCLLCRVWLGFFPALRV